MRLVEREKLGLNGSVLVKGGGVHMSEKLMQENVSTSSWDTHTQTHTQHGGRIVGLEGRERCVI